MDWMDIHKPIHPLGTLVDDPTQGNLEPSKPSATMASSNPQSREGSVRADLNAEGSLGEISCEPTLDEFASTQPSPEGPGELRRQELVSEAVTDGYQTAVSHLEPQTSCPATDEETSKVGIPPIDLKDDSRN